MWPKSIFNLQINFIYFLLLIPWPDDTHIIKLFCSKDNSRLVRKIIHSKWTPILDKYQIKLPLDCPLHPFRDLFAPRQDAKKRDRPTQWTCRKCGKSFYEEKFLDLHFETRHKSILNKDEDAVCLADLCDILRCEVFQSEESSSLTTADTNIVTDIEVWGDSLGPNSALAKANVAAYLSLIPLRTASSGASSRATKAPTNRQLCQQEKVKGQIKNKEKGNAGDSDAGGGEKTEQAERTKITNDSIKKGSRRYNDHNRSDGYATRSDKSAPHSNKAKKDAKWSTSNESDEFKRNKEKSKIRDDVNDDEDDDDDEDEDEDDDNGAEKNKEKNGKNSNTSSSSASASFPTTGNDTQTDDGTPNMQKMRANCRVDELSKLRLKCEQLVRGCVASSLLSMTDQAFKEMEEEMNKAVCWYLSCDRYWEDGPLEPRAFPWGLIIVLIFVLSMGICFCYYIIWILFDSEETTINANHQAYLHQQQQQQQKLPYQQGLLANTVTPSHYYYQQSQQQQQQQPPPTSQQLNELYPEQARYDYRHSPRRYSERTHHPHGTPTTTVGGLQPKHQQPPAAVAAHTLAYATDPYERRDYTSSRSAIGAAAAINVPLTTTTVTATAAAATTTATGLYIHPLAGAEETAASLAAADGGTRHYNPNQQQHHHQHQHHQHHQHHLPLEPHHRQIGASQTSLRGSSSAHEIIQSEVGHNEHYIYVTYPPDLKKRFFDKYE